MSARTRGYTANIFEKLAEAPSSTETFESSLWHAKAPAAPETGPVEGDIEVDVAVVGGGFLGASTALHLAESGVDVALIEADEAGFGASGRNTGFVVPNLLTGLDPRVMKDTLGPDVGDRLCRMLGEAGELVFDLIEKHGIECQSSQSGWIQPLHSPEKRAWLEDRVAQWQAMGRPVKALSREEAIAETGSEGYHGAFLDPTGGHLNPLAYVRGLTAAAIKNGAKVFSSSRVGEMTKDGKSWLLRIEGGGTVRANRILLTTNVSGQGLSKPAEGTQFPITLFQVATAPLDPELRKSVLPNNRSSADTRKDLIAFRWTPDNRIVTGGLLASPFGSAERARSHHLNRLNEILPQLPKLKAEYGWQGRLGAARDFMPRLMDIGEGAWSAIACNGRGMAMTTGLGKALARWLAGGSNEQLPISITKPDPVALPSLAPLAFSVWLPLNRWKDKRDIVRAKRLQSR